MLLCKGEISHRNDPNQKVAASINSIIQGQDSGLHLVNQLRNTRFDIAFGIKKNITQSNLTLMHHGACFGLSNMLGIGSLGLEAINCWFKIFYITVGVKLNFFLTMILYSKFCF